MQKKELMEILESIRNDIRDGRENTSREIKQLSSHIESIEKEWKEREETMIKRLEEIEARLTKVAEKKEEEATQWNNQVGSEREKKTWETLCLKMSHATGSDLCSSSRN